MCMTWRHLGITCDGTFAEYRAVPAFTAYKLPETISSVDAAFIEPISLRYVPSSTSSRLG